MTEEAFKSLKKMYDTFGGNVFSADVESPEIAEFIAEGYLERVGETDVILCHLAVVLLDAVAGM